MAFVLCPNVAAAAHKKLVLHSAGTGQSQSRTPFAVLGILVIVGSTLAGCGGSGTKIDVEPIETLLAAQSFRVHWPPREPLTDEYREEEPLLHGEIRITSQNTDAPDQFWVSLTLSRDESDKGRRRWNQQLAFPEHDWMSKVRVWDINEKWLWPNLPFLLRADGVERIDRYGGVDPGKGVDNDYAAVLVQPLSSSNLEVEQPAVTANWTAEDETQGGRRTVIHKAVSKPLLLSVANQPAGSLGVWLIYADFLDADPPRNWPPEHEDAGGILAWFLLSWSHDTDGQIIIKVEQATPPESTGFDWPEWNKKN